ncbi:hypothetical protein NC653_041163 [Populus alba x Populus x berolinensis]|uniref:Uncharacterized protein n=1 Tax=Populus alba x Populus x berolinensis TaxID=444605 RepID=A0AAD6L7T0_9ROSI|nr:hypothetical protein NC653_041163 [Populus alba x Populus x berolinensis]
MCFKTKSVFFPYRAIFNQIHHIRMSFHGYKHEKHNSVSYIHASNIY